MSNKLNLDVIEVNGEKYVREATIPAASKPPTGKRAVVVVDRGWVFAGDVERKDGRLLISRAVHARSWTEIGFDGLIASGGRGAKVKVFPLASTVDLPLSAELFSVPVEDTWGLSK